MKIDSCDNIQLTLRRRRETESPIEYGNYFLEITDTRFEIHYCMSIHDNDIEKLFALGGKIMKTMMSVLNSVNIKQNLKEE